MVTLYKQMVITSAVSVLCLFFKNIQIFVVFDPDNYAFVIVD